MGTGMEIQTFDRLTLFGRRWYFRIVDTGNWEIISTSEAYNKPGARNETANRLATRLACPIIPERSKR